MVLNKIKKVNTVLFFLFLIIAGLYYGASVLIPLTFGIFFTTLVLPVSNFLEQKTGASRITSSFLSTLLLFVGISLVFFLLFQQFGILLNDLIERKDEIGSYIGNLQREIMSATGFTIDQQEDLIMDRLSNIIEILQNFISGILAGLTMAILKFLLVLIYVFLLLINRAKFEEFLMMYISKEKREETCQIIDETKKVAYKYLWGRIQVMFLLGVLYTIAFTAYGLEHTPLLVIFGVIITIIPYIGPLISGIIPVLFIIVFGGSTGVVISFAIIVLIIQLIESYVLEPIIIGSEVQQSPLFIVLAIIIGGAIWGAAGLILFVPMFGILKIFFDHTRDLKPVGYLIGYNRPGSGEGIIEKIKKKFMK